MFNNFATYSFMLLTNIINIITDISLTYFSDGAKSASVRPIYKKKHRQNKENYRPVNI